MTLAALAPSEDPDLGKLRQEVRGLLQDVVGSTTGSRAQDLIGRATGRKRERLVVFLREEELERVKSYLEAGRASPEARGGEEKKATGTAATPGR